MGKVFGWEGKIEACEGMWWGTAVGVFLGEVGLGDDFHMVDTGVEHEAIAALHGQMTAVGVGGTVPWLLSIFSHLPISGGFGIFMKFCVDQLDKKISVCHSNSAIAS